MKRVMISVIIPCYKQAHYLPEAVNSVLAQTACVPVEITIVDDGSPDETAAVVRRYDERVKCIHKANAGLSAARNSGILATTGEWVIFLDADDYLPADALEKHLAAAAAAPHADVFYGTYHYVDQAGERFGPPFDPVLPVHAFHALLMGTYFPPHAVMTRRAALANSGLFDVTLRSLEDWDLWMRLAAAGSQFIRTIGLNVPYRQLRGSMSKDYERMRSCGMRVLKKNASLCHSNCAECARSIRSGRWGVRNAFLENSRSMGDGGLRGSRMLRAAAHDPLILIADLREALRTVKYQTFRKVGGDQ